MNKISQVLACFSSACESFKIFYEQIDIFLTALATFQYIFLKKKKERNL